MEGEYMEYSASAFQPETYFVEQNIGAENEISNGNDAEAARILVSIIERDPNNWRAYNNMGILSWSRKSWTDAFAMFKKSVCLCPDYEDALVNLFDVALKLKRVDEIKFFFDKALELKPDLQDVKSIRDAITTLKEDIYTTKRALSLGFYSPVIEEAEKELKAGNYSIAIEKYLWSIDTEGPSAEAYCGLGVISFHQQHFKDAFSLFIESIKLNPSDPETFLNLLDTSKEIGQTKAAKEIYTLYRFEFPELESITEDFNQI
jgi:tetratricopeptide (TPR) repeat protein